MAVRLFEVFVPALAMLCMAQAPTVDWDENVAESLFCLPGHGAPVLARRTAAGLTAMLAALAAMMLGFSVWVYPVAAIRVAGLTLPPAIFVAGLAMLAGTVFRSYPAAVTAGFALWIADQMLPGQLTGPLYLFRAGNPVAGGQAAGGGASGWGLPGLASWAARVGLAENRWLLFGTGLGLIVLAALIHSSWIRNGRAI
jgi:hypothetical protein